MGAEYDTVNPKETSDRAGNRLARKVAERAMRTLKELQALMDERLERVCMQQMCARVLPRFTARGKSLLNKTHVSYSSAESTWKTLQSSQHLFI